MATDNGEVVSVLTGDFVPTPSVYGNLITGRFDDTMQLADDMLELMIGAGGESGYLGLLADNILPTPDTTVPYENAETAVELTSIGTKPEFNGTIDDITVTEYAEPTILALPTIDLSALLPPVNPADVDPSIDWTATTPALTVFTDLLAALQSTSSGIDPAEEAAMYARAKERFQVANAKAYLDLNNDILSRHFQSPSGSLLSGLTEIQAVTIRQEAEIDNNIITTEADNARKLYEVRLGHLVALEGLIRQTQEATDAKTLAYAEAVATLAKDMFSERWTGYLAESEANKAYVTAQVENLKAVVASNTGATDVFKAMYEGMKTRVDAVASKNKSVTDVFVAETQAYGDSSRAISSENQIKLDKVRLDLQDKDLELKAAIASVSSIVTAYGTESQIREAVSNDMAAVCGHVLSSALTSVNASASLGYSASEARSENWGQSKSLSEAHSYEHDPEA